MEKVDGIGGFFFRSKNPDKLAKWYEDNFGINVVPSDYDTPGWRSEAGTTVFAPFKEDTTYFGDMKNQWMINFRSRTSTLWPRSLKRRAPRWTSILKNIRTDGSPQLFDPEGNPIQLWQPGGKDPG